MSIGGLGKFVNKRFSTLLVLLFVLSCGQDPRVSAKQLKVTGKGDVRINNTSVSKVGNVTVSGKQRIRRRASKRTGTRGESRVRAGAVNATNTSRQEHGIRPSEKSLDARERRFLRDTTRGRRAVKESRVNIFSGRQRVSATARKDKTSSSHQQLQRDPNKDLSLFSGEQSHALDSASHDLTLPNMTIGRGGNDLQEGFLKGILASLPVAIPATIIGAGGMAALLCLTQTICPPTQEVVQITTSGDVFFNNLPRLPTEEEKRGIVQQIQNFFEVVIARDLGAISANSREEPLETAPTTFMSFDIFDVQDDQATFESINGEGDISLLCNQTLRITGNSTIMVDQGHKVAENVVDLTTQNPNLTDFCLNYVANTEPPDSVYKNVSCDTLIIDFTSTTTAVPSSSPSASPSATPSYSPSYEPSAMPSVSVAPSSRPSEPPSKSFHPSQDPSTMPSVTATTASPSSSPSSVPSSFPSSAPSVTAPRFGLSETPSYRPSTSMEPSTQPSLSKSPTQRPSSSMAPTSLPSNSPTLSSSPSAESFNFEDEPEPWYLSFLLQYYNPVTGKPSENPSSAPSPSPTKLPREEPVTTAIASKADRDKFVFDDSVDEETIFEETIFMDGP